MTAVRRAVIAVLAGLMLVIAVPGTPAYAYDKVVDVTPTTMTENPAGSEGTVRATLHLGTVTAGTSHNLRSEIVVGNGRAAGAPGKIGLGHKITCQPVGGSTLPNTAAQHGQVWSGQNLLPGATDVRLTVRMLFTPVVTGAYDCLLRVYINNGLSSGAETASLRSGFIADIDGALGPAAVAEVFAPTTPAFFAIGGAGRQLNAVTAYMPAPGATAFLATGDLFATSCYGTGGNACPAGSYPTSGTAMVRYRVVATPSSTASGCVAQATPSATVPVTKDVHHLRILQQLTVTLPASGCGTWTVNAFVQADGGTLPFVINGGPYSLTYVRPPV